MIQTKNKQKVRRSFITLLELLIVMAVLVVATGVIGFNAAGMLKEQRFKSAADVVLDKLQMAQNIMLIFDTEVSLILENKEDGTFLCVLKTNRDLPPEFLEAINKLPVLSGLRTVVFEDERNGRQQGRVELLFSAINMSIPKGTLYLSGANAIGAGAMQRSIFLPGYPSPIGTIAKNVQQETLSYESELLYPKEIREEWLQKSQKKNEPKPPSVPSP